MGSVTGNDRENTSVFRDVLKKPGQSGRFRYSDLYFFWKYVRPYSWLAVTGLMMTLLGALSATAIPLSGKILIDFVVLKKNPDSVHRYLETLGLGSLSPAVISLVSSVDLLILALLAAGCVIGLAGIIQRYVIFRLQQAVTFSLQAALFNRLLRYPVSFFRERHSGYLMARVTGDVDLLQYLVSSYLPSVTSSFFRFGFGIVMLFFLNTGLALVSLGLIPVSVWINVFFAKRLGQASMEERERAAEVSEGMQEVLSGIETVKSFTAEEKESRRVEGRLLAALRGRLKSMIISLLSDYSARGSQFILTLIIMWLGAHKMLRGSMSVGDYVAFTSYILSISGPANTLSLVHVMLQPVFASLTRVKEIMTVAPEKAADSQAGRPSGKASFRGTIAYDRVTFGYEEGQPVLQDISFSVQPGETVAVTGPSGAGKTSLVSLLLKFYEPRSGCIRIDGQDLKDLPSGLVREKTAIVSQETFLFNDTVERNIRYGRPDATFEEVVEAARLADIHDEIGKMPMKYQTVIGERGVRVSAGQRQRISIARAFLKNPDILILDEPTSALDGHAEGIVRESLKKLSSGRTTFLISHRGSVLAIADRVLLLEDGRIREEETSQETSRSPDQA